MDKSTKKANKPNSEKTDKKTGDKYRIDNKARLLKQLKIFY